MRAETVASFVLSLLSLFSFTQISDPPSISKIPSFISSRISMVMMGLERLLGSLKSRLKSMKLKKPYDKIEKSESMRVEIRSRKARKLIEKTLKVADSPKTRTFNF